MCLLLHYLTNKTFRSFHEEVNVSLQSCQLRESEEILSGFHMIFASVAGTPLSVLNALQK